MPIPLRADFDAQMVRSAARRSKDGPQARRLLALAAIYEGAGRFALAALWGLFEAGARRSCVTGFGRNDKARGRAVGRGQSTPCLS